MQTHDLDYLTSSDHVYDLIRSCGYRPCLCFGVLSAAFTLSQPEISREQLLKDSTAFFRTKAGMVPSGLDSLPSCWLAQLPALLWATREPHWAYVPYMIHQLSSEQGALCLAFAQEMSVETDRLTRWDQLRIELNLLLRPNLWQPLTREMEEKIWRERPNLRRDLFHLPY